MNTYTHVCRYTYICVCVYANKHTHNMQICVDLCADASASYAAAAAAATTRRMRILGVVSWRTENVVKDPALSPPRDYSSVFTQQNIIFITCMLYILLIDPTLYATFTYYSFFFTYRPVKIASKKPGTKPGTNFSSRF